MIESILTCYAEQNASRDALACIVLLKDIEKYDNQIEYLTSQTDAEAQDDINAAYRGEKNLYEQAGIIDTETQSKIDDALEWIPPRTQEDLQTCAVAKLEAQLLNIEPPATPTVEEWRARNLAQLNARKTADENELQVIRDNDATLDAVLASLGI